MPKAKQQPLSAAALGIALWGVLGVLALLSQAIYRLTPIALEPLQKHLLANWQLGIYIAWTLFNAYAEGYRGFQRAFSPRVVSRSLLLGRNPRALHVVLAPLYCMALFHAKRRNLIMSRTLVVAIVLVVLLVHQLAQPWRGIVDAGVVVGLVWGAISIVVMFVGALTGRFQIDASSLPDPVEEQ